MATYPQQGAKRQKIREARVDNVDYCQGIDKLEYSAASAQASRYRHYSAGERMHSRSMDDWLRCSISLADFRGRGSDPHIRPAFSRQWDDHTSSIDNYKRCIKALFDFCSKLGIKYWTAFDTDLVPYSETWEESKTNWDEIVEYIQELGQRTHVKLLWMAPDLHSHTRYASGALTSHDATTFAQAAWQIKRCLEASQRLNAECFLLWPHREGYDAIFQTDVAREIKLFAKLLKMAADYKERLNYRCQLLIMPYRYSRIAQSWQHCRWEGGHSYIWDVTSCLCFLKNYNLDRYYKVCTPPGHHMFMASVYNMLGGVSITNNFDQHDIKKLTLMMKCIVDQGAPPPGGINLQLTPRFDSDLRDVATLYVKYIDATAKALRLACGIVAEQIFVKHLQQRYSSYSTGFGSRVANADLTLEDCEEHYRKNQSQSEVNCSKTEQLDLVFQRYLDACEHV